MKPILLIFLLLLFTSAHAQTVHGVVTEGRTGKALYPVTVVNASTQQSVYTSEDGSFTLPAKVGDKVIFTLVGYSTAQETLTIETYNKPLLMQLVNISYQLDEFILRPKYTPYQVDSLHRRAVYERTLAWKRSSTIMSPVSFIADRISGKSRRRFAFQKNFNRWEDEKYTDTRYTPELVVSLTGLSGDSLGHFMNAYPMSYDYARAASDLELKMWIRYHYKLWMQNPVIPTDDSIVDKAKQ